MAKKIPSASINITSALRSILTQSDVKRSVVDQNRLINSKIRVTGGAFAAAGNALSPIDHVAISYAGSTFNVTLADLISAVTDTIKVSMDYGIKPKDFVSNLSDKITSFSIGKGLKDFAPATESIKIAMGFNRAYASVQSAPLDRRFIGSSKVLSTVTDPIDSTSRGFVKSAKDFINNISDTVRPSLTKSLKDFVIPLDYMTITDGSTFEDVKVVKDLQPAIENLSRTVSYNRAYQDTQPAEDRSFKGLFKSFADFVSTEDVLDFNRFKEATADDTLNLADINVKGIIKPVSDTAIPLDYMTIDDGSTFEDVKVLRETLFTSDVRTTDYSKPIKEFQAEYEGPRRGLAGDYSLNYFFDDYTEDLRPVWDINKAVADFVIPLDYMEIFDGSTFDDVKVLRETLSTPDIFSRTISFIRRYDDSVSILDDGNAYSITKAFKDTATAIDLMTIADGSTFDDVKVLRETLVASDTFTRVLSFNRRVTEVLIAGSHNEFTFTKPLTETVDTSNDGSGHDTYAFNYFLDSGNPYYYTNRWIPILNFNKAVKDFVIPLDYMTITDGSTFEDVKRLFDTVTVPDRIPLDLTKPLKDTADKFEGPGFGSQEDYSFGYFTDDYTTDPRPIWTIYKPFVEPLSLIEVFTLSYTPARKFVETMVVSDFGGDVFDLHKPFADSVGTLDETTITDGGLYTIFKTFVETLRVVEGPASRFLEDYIDESITDGKPWTDPTYIADNIPIYTIVKPLSDFVIPLDYMTIADGSTFEDVKPIFDSVSIIEAGQNTFDLVKPFTEAQPHFEGPGYYGTDEYAIDYFDDKFTEEFKPIWTIYKPFADSVIPLDYMTIADGSTFEDVKPFIEPPLIVTSFSSFDWIKTKDEVMVASDRFFPWVLNQAKFEYLNAPEGPAYHDATGYAIDWVYESKYTEVFSPILDITKILPGDFQSTLDHNAVTFQPGTVKDFIDISDFGNIFDLNKVNKSSVELEDYGTLYSLTKVLSDSVIPLDYMTIVDGSTFEDVKPLPPEFVGVFDDGNTFDFNKAKNDFISNIEDYGTLFTLEKVLGDSVRPKEGPALFDGDDYVPQWIDPAYLDDGRLSYNIIKVLPGDFAVALDYMTISDGSTFDYSNVLPPDFVSDISDDGNTFDFNKAKAELQPASDVLQPFITNLVKRDTVIPPQGPVYYDYTRYSIDYLLDSYTEFFGPKYTLIKVLPTDYAIALDYMTIADGSTFEDVKILSSINQSPTDKVTASSIKVLASFQSRETEGPGYGNDGDYAIDYVYNTGYTESLRSIWSFTKALADSVIPLDYMTISDGSTFDEIKVLATLQPAPSDDDIFDFNKVRSSFVSNIEDNGNLFEFTKVLGDFQSVRQGPVNYSFDGYVPGFGDPAYLDDGNILYTFSKVLSDSVIPLDYLTIADGSTFDYTNVLPPDFVSDISDDGNTFDFNKGQFDFVTNEDYGTLYSITLVKRDYAYAPQGPVYYDDAGYSVGYFQNLYTEYFNIQYSLAKVIRDEAIALDYMTISDGSTFDYTNVLPPEFVADTSDFTTTHPTKALSSSNTGTSDRLLPFTFIKGLADEVFADEVLRIQQPLRADKDDPQMVPQLDADTFNLNKRLSSTAIPLDYMTIDDGSTFSDVKPLFDILDSPTDGSGHDTYAFNYFLDSGDPYYYTNRWIPIFEFDKVLKDFVIPLDYMTITDGSTFSEVKVLASIQPSPSDRISNISAGKVLGSIQPGVEDNGNVFNFNKAIADFQLTRQGPGENSASDYAYDGVGDYGSPVWMDPSYIDDGRAIFSLYKTFNDSVIPLDYMTITDGSTFSDIKPLSSSVGTSDFGNIFDLTKPLTDRISREFEGPGYGSIVDFSPGYFLDDYTEDLRPIWTFSKALSDSVIPLDYMTIVDGSTFEDVKPLPPEFVTANSFSSFDWTKTKSETMVASDILLPFNINLVKFDYAPQSQGPVYYDYTQYSTGYLQDTYTEYFGPKYTFIKVLPTDFVIPLDYMTITDGSTFEDVKILSSVQSAPQDAIANHPQKVLSSINTLVSDLLLPFTFVKGLSDFVGTDDNLSIAQPYVFDRGNPQKVYQLDDDIFNFNKAKNDFITNEDGSLYTFNKVLSDTANTREGPGENNASDYAYNGIANYSSPVWMDPSYIDDSRPVYNYIKILPADYVTALDYMTIVDGSTFADVKPLSSFVDTASNDTFNFNKRKADVQPASDTLLPFTTGLVKRDTVIQPQGPVYYNKAGYSPGLFSDDYTEFFGPKYTLVKILPTDYAIPLDYMTISDGSTFDYTNVLPPEFVDSITDKATNTPTKAITDFQVGLGDGKLHGQSWYATNYFEGYSSPLGSTDSGVTADSGASIDTYLYTLPGGAVQYTVEYRPTIVFDKVLSDTPTERQGPVYYDGDIYCVGYFPTGQDYIGYQGPTFNFTKSLSSTTNGSVIAGNIYKNSYVAGAFFATDFIGNAYTLA